MYKTLIVDDERSVHQAICSLVDWDALRLERPESAYDGAEALARMAALRPGIAFVDINMPRMNGLDFLSRATECWPETRFIVVSGYDSFDFARAAIRLNAVDYLLKPIDSDELAAALRKALSGLPAQPQEARTPGEIAGEIRRYIDGNLRGGINVDALAERFHFSREYIERIFRAQHGCAVYEYIQQERMKQAAELLKNPRLSLQAIAEHLGFSNANYFSKAFRRFHHCSPSEYRERLSDGK